MSKPIIITLVLLSVLLFTASAVESHFQIIKTYPTSIKPDINLGKLVITTEAQYKEVSSFIDPDYPSLVTENDF